MKLAGYDIQPLKEYNDRRKPISDQVLYQQVIVEPYKESHYLAQDGFEREISINSKGEEVVWKDNNLKKGELAFNHKFPVNSKSIDLVETKKRQADKIHAMGCLTDEEIQKKSSDHWENFHQLKKSNPQAADQYKKKYADEMGEFGMTNMQGKI